MLRWLSPRRRVLASFRWEICTGTRSFSADRDGFLQGFPKAVFFVTNVGHIDTASEGRSAG